MGEVTLFPAPKRPKLEVHEHSIIRGPRANSPRSSIEHSHEGGDVPHTHPETGPAHYTIDKDEWLRATGLRGGGRKRFTDAPAGEQLEFIARRPEDSVFEVIVCDPPAPPGFKGEGGGLHAAARMAMAFGLRPIVRAADDHEPPEAA